MLYLHIIQIYYLGVIFSHISPFEHETEFIFISEVFYTPFITYFIIADLGCLSFFSRKNITMPRSYNWEEKRELLGELYLERGQTLHEIMQFMQTEHNFNSWYLHNFPVCIY